MKKIIILIFCTSVLIGCKTKEKAMTNESQELTKEMFFSLYRGACYGTCPSYKITFNGDGSFTYFGKRYVDRLGAYKGNITNEETQNLFNKLAMFDWSSYPDEYPIDNVDFPQFTIEYFDNSMKKKIMANSNAATELIELSKNIDAIIKSVTMKKLD